jgi:hypothetical protein
VETGEELIQQTAGILVGVTGILVGVTKVFVNTTVVAPLRYVATVAQASIQQTAGILVGVTKVFVNTTVVTPLRYVVTVAQASIPVKLSWVWYSIKLSGKRRKPLSYTPRRKPVK